MATSFVNTRRWSQTSSGIPDTRATDLHSFKNSYRRDTVSNATPGSGTFERSNPTSRLYGDKSILGSSRNDNSRYRWDDEYNKSEERRPYNYEAEDNSGYLLPLESPWSVDRGRAFVSQPALEGIPSITPIKNDSVISSNFRHDLFQSSPYTTNRTSTTGPNQFVSLKEPVTYVTSNLRNWSQDAVADPTHNVYPLELESANDNTMSAGFRAVNNISKLASRIKAVGEILDRYDQVGPQRKDETGYLPEEIFHEIPMYVSDNNTYDDRERQSLKTEKSNVWTSRLDRNAPQSAIETYRNMRTSAPTSKIDDRKSKSVFDLRASPENEYSDVQPYLSRRIPKKILGDDTNYDARKHAPNSSSDDLRTFRSFNRETNNSKVHENSVPAFNPIKDYKRSWISESNLVTPSELDCLQDRIDAISTKFNYVPRAYRYILRNNNSALQDKSLPDGEYVEDKPGNDQLKTVNVWFPRKLLAKLKPQFNAASSSDTKTPAINAKHVSWGDDTNDSNSKSNNLEQKYEASARNAYTEPTLVRRSISTDYSATHPPSKAILTNYSFPSQPSSVNVPPESSRSNYSTPTDNTRDLSRQLVRNVDVPMNKLLLTQNLSVTSPERSLTAATTNISSKSLQSAFDSAVSERLVTGMNNPSLVITTKSSYNTTSSLANASNNLNKTNTYVSSGSLLADRNPSGEYSQNGISSSVKLNKDTNLLTRLQSDLRELSNQSESSSAYFPRCSVDMREIPKGNIDSLYKQNDDFRSKLGFNSESVAQVTTTGGTNSEDYCSPKSHNVARDPVQFSNGSIPAPIFYNQKPTLKQSTLAGTAPSSLSNSSSVCTSISPTITNKTVYTKTYSTRPVTEGATGNITDPNQFSTTEKSSELFNYIERSSDSLSLEKMRLGTLQKSLPRPNVTFSTSVQHISAVTVYNDIHASEASKLMNSINAPISTATVKSSSHMFNSPSTTWSGSNNVTKLTNSTFTSTSASTDSLYTSSTYVVPTSKVTSITNTLPYDSYRKNSLSTFNIASTPTGQIWSSPLAISSASSGVTFSHGSSTVIAKHSPNLTPAFNFSPPIPITSNSTCTLSTKTLVATSVSGVPTFNDIYKEKAITYSPTSSTSNALTLNSVYTVSWNTPVSTSITTAKIMSSPAMFQDVSSKTLSTTSASSPSTTVSGAYTLSSSALTTPTTYSSPTLDSMSINQNLLSSIEALRKLSSSLSNRRTQEAVTRTGNILYTNQPNTVVSGSDNSELGHSKGTITSTDGLYRNNSISTANNDSVIQRNNFLTSNLSSDSSRQNFEKTGREDFGNDRTGMHLGSPNQYDNIALPNSNSNSSIKSYVSPVSYQMHQYSTAQSRPITCTTSSFTQVSNVTDLNSAPSYAGPISPTLSSYRNNYFDPNVGDSTIHGSFTNLSMIHTNDKSLTSLPHSITNSLTTASLNTSLGTNLSSSNRSYDSSTNGNNFWHKNASTPDLTLFSERAMKRASEIPVEIFSSTKASSASPTTDWLPKYTYTSEYDSYDSSYHGAAAAADCLHLTLPPVTYNRHRSISSTDSEDHCLADDWTTAMNFHSAASPSRHSVDDATSRSSDTEFVVMRSGEIVQRRRGRDNGDDVIQTI